MNRLKASTPNESQAEAIRTFLREAWKAGEFTLAALMRALEQIVDDDDTLTVHSARQWLIIEPDR
jgi:hypothetical protein